MRCYKLRYDEVCSSTACVGCAVISYGTMKFALVQHVQDALL